MTRFRKPFYVSKKHAATQILATLVSSVYIITTLIGIYMSTFGVGIAPGLQSLPMSNNMLTYQSPREYIYNEMNGKL